jgi:hypothetical protein
VGATPDDFSTQVHVFIGKGIIERKIYFLTDRTRFICVDICAVLRIQLVGIKQRFLGKVRSSMIDLAYSSNLNCSLSDISKTSFNRREKVVLYRINYDLPLNSSESFIIETSLDDNDFCNLTELKWMSQTFE